MLEIQEVPRAQVPIEVSPLHPSCALPSASLGARGCLNESDPSTRTATNLTLKDLNFLPSGTPGSRFLSSRGSESGTQIPSPLSLCDLGYFPFWEPRPPH